MQYIKYHAIYLYMQIFYYIKTIIMSSRRTKDEKKAPSVSDLLARIIQLEETILRSVKTVNSESEENTTKTVDFTPYMTLREKSPLLLALYPGKEDGSRIYTPLDTDLGTTTSGYWPGGRQWVGLYLGGTDGSAGNRRLNTIPMCLANSLPFYSPMGLTASVSDTGLRLEAMNSCSSAVMDFSGENCQTNWTAAFELIYFFATGFMHVSTVAFPINTASACLKFEEGDRIINMCGPHLALTTRKRRQDYYDLLRVIIDAMDGWVEFPNNKMLEGNVINYRANFVKPHLEGVRLTVLDRYAVVRSIPSMESDIGTALKIIASMLVLAEMRTKEFMDANTGIEWAWIRSEYANLQLRAEKASALLSESEGGMFDGFSMQAFVDLIAMTDAALQGHRHLV